MEPRNILVAGIPRSGTTWVANVLSASPEMAYFHEPDNERHNLLGYIYKRYLPRFPYLAADDRNEQYRILFEHAFSGRYLETNGSADKLIKKLVGFDRDRVERRIRENSRGSNIARRSVLKYGSARILHALIARLKSLAGRGDILVKSVHSVLALEFIDHHFHPDILVIFRHPANVIQSYQSLDLNDRRRNIFRDKKLIHDYLSPYLSDVEALEDPLEKAAAQVGAFYYVLERQLDNHPGWHSVHHEQLCADPVTEFEKLYSLLNLKWSGEVADYINRLDTGGGEGFSIQRVSARQIDKWKRKLDPDQVEKIVRGFTIFDHDHKYDFDR